MIAMGGFGDNYPILIYNWEENDSDNLLNYKERL